MICPDRIGQIIFFARFINCTELCIHYADGKYNFVGVDWGLGISPPINQ